MELYQAEWCPHSHRVRQRLTELGLDFTARQVPADPEDRKDLSSRFGTNEIPVLVVEGEEPVCGDDAILDYLGRYHDCGDAAEHRAKSREEVPQFAA